MCFRQYVASCLSVSNFFANCCKTTGFLHFLTCFKWGSNIFSNDSWLVLFSHHKVPPSCNYYLLLPPRRSQWAYTVHLKVLQGLFLLLALIANDLRINRRIPAKCFNVGRGQQWCHHIAHIHMSGRGRKVWGFSECTDSTKSFRSLENKQTGRFE